MAGLVAVRQLDNVDGSSVAWREDETELISGR